MAEVENRTVEADEAGMRLDRWFKAHFPDLPFGHLQKLLRSGQIRVDGGRVRTSSRLEPGQAVRVPPLSYATSREAPAVDDDEHVATPSRAADRNRASSAIASTRGSATGRAATGKPGASKPAIGKMGVGKANATLRELRDMTLFEDELVLVLNKPPGLAVQGGSGLTNHLDAMLEALRDDKDRKPRLVHRLDRETSGVIIVAKTRLAASQLAASFRGRSTRKIYWALVAGMPKPRQGRVSTWLAKDIEAGEGMMIARHGHDDATHAVSLYSVVDHAGSQLSWLSMRPVTGRTHQLRAHAAHIGHPIVGDPLYFDLKDWELPGGLQNRLHLHARRLVLPHPDGGTIDVTAPLPPHMQQSWNLLGFDKDLGTASEGPDEE
ncbi:MAG: RluA family pseudouridine synthase [Bauldia sp.]|nr:RluA family pseudouridine synthase [Bauldia sp.]